MKVSIVTVCFHSEKTNADTLKSLSARTHHEIEHIMIDGGSRDPTRAMVPDHGDRIASVVSERGDEILIIVAGKGMVIRMTLWIRVIPTRATLLNLGVAKSQKIH